MAMSIWCAASTGRKSRVIFAVGGDSFILRSESELDISGAGFLINSLRIITGRLLSVFAKRDPVQQLRMSASTATIGIRGTGVYIEADPELTYICTCYGQVALSVNDDPDDSELIASKSHDQPRYIGIDAVREDEGDGPAAEIWTVDTGAERTSAEERNRIIGEINLL